MSQSSYDETLTVPRTLLGLIQLQAGSVVSRTLVKKAAGTLSLFAFDEGEGLSEHSTPHDALVQVLEGTATISVGGVAHLVEAGEVLLLPANIPHALQAPVPFKMLLTMIREPE
ncbi:MAG: cupin domain-containing protein [Gemmatimonadota bacterium]|jgi:quercetin dioxygenase-like cupin family protein